MIVLNMYWNQKGNLPKNRAFLYILKSAPFGADWNNRLYTHERKVFPFSFVSLRHAAKRLNSLCGLAHHFYTDNKRILLEFIGKTDIISL